MASHSTTYNVSMFLSADKHCFKNVHCRALRAFSSSAPSPPYTAVLSSPAPQREPHPFDRCLTRLTRPGARLQAAPTPSRNHSRSRSRRVGRGTSSSAPTHRCTATLPYPMLRPQQQKQKQELSNHRAMRPRAVLEQSHIQSRSRSSRLVRMFTKYVLGLKRT